MQFSEFPSCCGINIQYGITGSKESVAQALKTFRSSRTRNVVGMNLIALNDGQKITYHNTLIAEGWDLIVNGAHNYNHDSRIYLYACVFRKEMSEPNLYPMAEVDY